SHASSSASFISTSRDSDDDKTCSDSAITRASTQPPIVTDPRIRPASPTHIFAPSRFGPVPRVATSVAIATRFSARAIFSMSSKSSSMSQHQVWLEHAQAGKIVRGCEHVDVRQRCLHATRRRLIFGTTEQRIEPDQTSGAILQLRKCVRELFGFACVPSVAENYDYGSFVDAAQPLLIERRQTRTDSCAAGPSAHVGRQAIEGAFVSFVFQVACYSRERSGEDERFHFRETVLQSVDELQQQAAVAVHRSGNITDDDELGSFWTSLFVTQLNQFAA